MGFPATGFVYVVVVLVVVTSHVSIVVSLRTNECQESPREHIHPISPGGYTYSCDEDHVLMYDGVSCRRRHTCADKVSVEDVQSKNAFEKYKQSEKATERDPNETNITLLHMDAPEEDIYHIITDETICRNEHDIDCPSPRPLNYVRNKQTDEEYDPDRALHSLPDCLVVKESNIPDAGLGVFAEKEIPARTVFGPYAGVKVIEPEEAYRSGYSFEIEENGKIIHFIDAKDEAFSNWLRYVKSPNYQSEENVVAFQYKDAIYFRTFKPIFPGEELLAWFGDGYAAFLGRDVDGEDSNPDTEATENETSVALWHMDAPEEDVYQITDPTECQDKDETGCPPLNYVRNKQTGEEYDPDRALHSLPDGLVVKESNIPDAGQGVFAEKEIPARTVFGPYAGVKVIEPEEAYRSGYSFEIEENGEIIHFIDAKFEAYSNWLRYVNSPNYRSDENIVSFQYNYAIYYRTSKPILRGEELLVWYGDGYAKFLGLDLDKG